MNAKVGAGIVNIITESLYDRPIVVFREYVQNSVDSFGKSKIDEDEFFTKIWLDNSNLCFLDNGNGISRNEFYNKMIDIANSEKKRAEHIGYKGIGRLSGLPYCNKLIFINICSFKNNDFQEFYIDGSKYKELKNKLNDYDLDDLMNEIGTYSDHLKGNKLAKIQSILNLHKDIFTKQDTGFLVILEKVTHVLMQTIASADFYQELGWLLPVKFKDELYESNVKYLLEDLNEPIPQRSVIPAKSYNIRFNDKIIERPITKNMLRDYTCMIDLNYAVGFHSFNRDKIAIARGNSFFGIRLYIDNFFLCDENELIPILVNSGLIKHSISELIQSVRGIGAILYITDKINISTNARRTFIELTDKDSFDFLELLAEFVRNIYKARYELSKYRRNKDVMEQNSEKLEQLRESANLALQKLASDVITVEVEYSVPKEFDDFDDIEKKKFIKQKLTNDMNTRIKEYLSQTTSFDYVNATMDFITWLVSNKNDKL
ncbi:hypothetical protein F8154_05675 [Alkaliphilus pronyensis]|uniref:ATP-binding protein n=1 Tax=Alkaliphilus pronyensis TaxID=1482732 RepID=A0A6I0FCX7_9FIRM|nr:ATP-binding protein [Alkaliphilus pronyensis]KAB3535620.1 hypothetical protein F8154_05675 [Alkaliphilus pronyensis]